MLNTEIQCNSLLSFHTNQAPAHARLFHAVLSPLVPTVVFLRD